MKKRKQIILLEISIRPAVLMKLWKLKITMRLTPELTADWLVRRENILNNSDIL